MIPVEGCISNPERSSCFRLFAGLAAGAALLFFVACGQGIVDPGTEPFAGNPDVRAAVPVPAEGEVPPGVGRIAYIGQAAAFGQHHIFLVRPDGKDRISLMDPEDRADYTGPSWSPDGQQIAFASNRSGQANYEIYIMNLDGSGLRQIVEHIGGDFAPSWSPDGQLIVYQTVGTVETGFDIFVVNVDGTGGQNLTQSEGADQLPTWSPDGRKIAFQSGQGNGTDIFVMDADGSNRVRLTDGKGSQHAAPAWSPDGQRIAFESTRHQPLAGQLLTVAEYEVYTINVDGTDIKRVTQVSSPLSGARNPTWSPDNKQIAFEFQRGDEVIFRKAIAVINADGSGVYEIPNIELDGGFPRWSPIP